jgi:hypothetical protein
VTITARILAVALLDAAACRLRHGGSADGCGERPRTRCQPAQAADRATVCAASSWRRRRRRLGRDQRPRAQAPEKIHCVFDCGGHRVPHPGLERHLAVHRCHLSWVFATLHGFIAKDSLVAAGGRSSDDRQPAAGRLKTRALAGRRLDDTPRLWPWTSMDVSSLRRRGWFGLSSALWLACVPGAGPGAQQANPERAKPGPTPPEPAVEAELRAAPPPAPAASSPPGGNPSAAAAANAPTASSPPQSPAPTPDDEWMACL